MDWDDLKIFLAIARAGSVRGAANELDINQSTVSRRIAAFEHFIGTALFEKLPTGFEITPAGKEILTNVGRIEKEVFSIDRHLFKRQPDLSGTLKVALPAPLATNLLMPDITLFCKNNPNIDLELAVSNRNTNLSKREADIALRVLKPDDLPPPYLVGIKLVSYASSVYCAKSQLNKDLTWIKSDDTDSHLSWLKQEGYTNIKFNYTVDHLTSLVEAVKAGLGKALLPCCFADIDDSLIRVPPGSIRTEKDIWLLIHPDFKDTPRVRVFLEFIKETFEKHRALLEGRLAKN